MPGMDGVETTLRIRAIGSEYAASVPIIALTANAIVGNEKLFLKSGFQAFLSKPVDLAKLDGVVRQWIMNGEHLPVDSVQFTESKQRSTIAIPGVDTEKALYLFDGDEEMLLDFLRSYVEYIPAELDKLRDVCAGNLPDYAIDVHTVKGASAGIGADGLAESAKQLEKMAKAGDIAGVSAGNEVFIKEVETLIANIRAAI
jgi:CheY-like chemotaxis protein